MPGEEIAAWRPRRSAALPNRNRDATGLTFRVTAIDDAVDVLA